MKKDDDLVKRYLETRNKLKKRFLSERLQKQDATQIFEEQFAPLIEPTRETVRETKEVKEALATLPRKIARELEEPPQYASQLKTRAQFFNEAGRQSIVDLGPEEAAAKIPLNWATLLLSPIRKPSLEEWQKFIYREYYGTKQASGPVWEDFLQRVPVEVLPGIFNEEGKKKIEDNPIAVALNFPKDWKNLLTKPPKSASSAKKDWSKMVYRQYTGKKQARGEGWEDFKKVLEAERTKVGSGIKYYNNPEELFDRFEILVGTVRAGNTSRVIRNEASNILDRLLKDGDIDEELFKELWDIFK